MVDCCVERSCGNYDGLATISHLHAVLEQRREVLEREVALCDLLAGVLAKLSDGTVMGVHMGKTFAGREWIAPALEQYEAVRRG